jgi:hypothetical protein
MVLIWREWMGGWGDGWDPGWGTQWTGETGNRNKNTPLSITTWIYLALDFRFEFRSEWAPRRAFLSI